MSDKEVLAALEQMERWLDDPSWNPDPDALAAWNAGLQGALAKARKAEDWPALRDRAHGLGRRLEERMLLLVKARDALKAELDAQSRGNRALKGYGASTR